MANDKKCTKTGKTENIRTLLFIVLIVFLLSFSGCTEQQEEPQVDTESTDVYLEDTDESLGDVEPCLLVMESTYDNNGELSKLSNTCYYSYDEQGKVLAEIYNYYTTGIQEELINYGISTGAGFTINYDYPDDHTIIGYISGKDAYGDSSGGYLVRTCDDNGNLLSQYSYDEYDNLEDVQEWSYYDDNEMRSYLMDTGSRQQYEDYKYNYNSTGQKVSCETHLRYYNGEELLVENTYTTYYEYDSNANLIKEYYKTNDSNSVTINYEYDQNGNLIKKTEYRNGSLEWWTEYEYMKESEIVGTTESVTENESLSDTSADAASAVNNPSALDEVVLESAKKVVDDYLNNPVENGFAKDMGYLTIAAENGEIIYWIWHAGGGYGIVTQSAVEPYTILSTSRRQLTTDQLLAWAIYEEQGLFTFKDIEYVGYDTVVYHGELVPSEHWIVTMADDSSCDYNVFNAIGSSEVITTAFFKNREPWVYMFWDNFMPLI